MDKNFIQRAISGLVYIIILISCTHPIGKNTINTILSSSIQQSHLYFGLILFLFAISLLENVKIMKFGNGYEKWIVYPLAIFIFYIFAKRYFSHDFYFNFRISEILAILLILIAVITLFKHSNELYFDNGKLIYTVIYIALPFGFALGLPSYSNTESTFTLEVFYMFILIWSSDTFAYITGKFFGKHKFAPKISPKKTWEGFIGGVVLTLVFSFFIEKYNPELRGNWMAVGFLISIFAPIGDLVESQLKRNFGVKDSGNIIPGHGGVLDRLDSFIIVVPALYLYFILEKMI